MKKALIIAGAVLAMAACKNTGGATTEGDTAAAGDRNVETVYDIAFIRMDSLVQNYDRFVDLSSAFEAKATKVTGDLEARARSLQNEMVSFEDKINKGLMTSRDAKAEQTRIQTKGQQFENDRQTQVAQLAEEEQVMTNQVFYAVNDYVAKFNADLRYKMILTTSGGSPVIHADPALDITAEVLRGLNAEYAAEKAAK
ncbi:MAG: OmpH family outer membrane protein [Alistipes sp.]|jgi:outer membrane protein|nr:OmpH family outer membrane protein [Alistipes sp.]